MSSDTLQEFIEGRLLAFQPDIDLSNGSPAQDQIIDPLVRRYQPDPFEMSIEEFISARLAQEYPDVNFSEGSGVRDLLVKPSQILMDPIAREVQLMKQQQSIAAPELLADSEADALIANVFVTRNLGSLASGVVRLYFNAPISINISIGNVCFTSSGLRFIPTTLQSISAEAMVFNQSGSLSYFDINVSAEQDGLNYNIDKGAIVGITNLNVAVRVTNLARFENGLDRESTIDLVSRAQSSITERSLVVPRGVSARLHDQFNTLQHLQVVGFSDVDMLRDTISGGDLGRSILSGNDGYTEDDGLGGTSTTLFHTRFQSILSALAIGPLEDHYLLATEVRYGVDGAVDEFALNHFISGSASFSKEDEGSLLYVIKTSNPSNAGPFRIASYISPTTVELAGLSGVEELDIWWQFIKKERQIAITEVVSDSEIRLAESLPSHASTISWSIRKKEITLSDMPGGILFSSDQEVLHVSPGEVHVGGCTDFYVSGSDTDTKNVVISSISDAAPLVYALTGNTDSGNTTKAQFFFDTTKDFVALGVRAGHSLIIASGVDVGTRQILRVGIDWTGAANVSYVQLDSPITSSADSIRYSIVDVIDVNLKKPITLRCSGSDGQTVQLSSAFTTSSALDFLSLGVAVDDTLSILEGDNKGDYRIAAISGVGNKVLSLGQSMVATDTALSYSVFKAQDGIEFPLIRIKSIDILDSSSQPTGDTLPRSEPVDAISTTFSNAAHGVKLSITDAITGIVGDTDVTTVSSLPSPCTVQISVNGTPVTVTLSGLSGLAAINHINSVIPSIASTLMVGGQTRLTLRSTNRWLRVTGGTAFTALGIAVGDDNRQIRSLAQVDDWSASSYDIRGKADTVSLFTGDNVGRAYLVGVYSDRILVTMFDENDGSVRFMAPNTDVAMSVGSRSLGTARVYFMDPTSFEVRGSYRPALKSVENRPANLSVFSPEELGSSYPPTIAEDENAVTYFTATVNGSLLRFTPDPELYYTVIPDASSDVPNNLTVRLGGMSADTVAVETAPSGSLGKNSRGSSVDFLTREIRVGDCVQITYQPIQGSVDLAALIDATPHALDGKRLVLSIDGAPFKTVQFSSGHIASTDNVAEEINTAMGASIAFLETIDDYSYLRLEADFVISVATGNANSILGISIGTNRAQAAIDGFYMVTDLDPSPYSALTPNMIRIRAPNGLPPATPSGPASNQAQHFNVLRSGVQRIHSTAMSKQIETGLYYMDVELVSDGSGDAWNLPAGTEFVVTGYTSDGYSVTVKNPNLSYSSEEDLDMRLSRRLLTVGQSDRPDQALKLSNQNIQINYERSQLVASIQSFTKSDLDRVLTASILVRHLFPTFINFDLSYRGGSATDVVLSDIMSYLSSLAPNERVQASDIQNKALRRSATYVSNPVSLVAVNHDRERKITVERSTDHVSKGTLSMFLPGTINVSKGT